AGGGEHGVFVQRAHAFVGDDEGVHARAESGAGDAADIAHVGDAVEDEEERRFALVHYPGNDLLQLEVLNLREYGHAAFMVADVEAVELFHRHVVDGHTLLGCSFFHGVDRIARGFVIEVDTVEALARAQGFEYGAAARYERAFLWPVLWSEIL